MFVPYAYEDQECPHYDELLAIMKKLNESYLDGRCQVGSAANILQYKCPGTCLDYIFDKLNTKYAFGWEIYGISQSERSSARFLAMNKEETCFSYFNPMTSSLYDKTLNTWLNVIKDLL